MSENINNEKILKEKFKFIDKTNTESEKILRPSMSYWQDAWRRLKQNKVAIVALIILILITILTMIGPRDRKSTRLNSSHANISYAVFCLKKIKKAHVCTPIKPIPRMMSSAL